MDYSQPFSVLNQRLRPRYLSIAQLVSPLQEVDETQVGSLRSKTTSQRPTVMPAEMDPKDSVTKTEPGDPEEAGNKEELVSDGLQEEIFAALPGFPTSSLLTEMNLTDVGEGESADDDSGTSQKGSSGEQTSDGTRDSTGALTGEDGSPFQRGFFDGTLPDLLKNGKPLGRRRTLGHVSETLKEVRREVELSRRRSIKLKAQVDKLQERRDGPGWSQHRERVTEEVLSILRLLHPLTEPESSQPEPCEGENCLDAALAQLQNVARKLAISQTKQDIKPGKKGEEESAILQQALWDRDEAIEKKKAMEAELLRSKTELMALNNQLLEAVQKRLELSLEVEAWKEDVQRILQQQLQNQQQAEQAQKKTSRLGILRRNNKPPIQRPSNFPLSTPSPPTTNTKQIFLSKSAASGPSTPPSSLRWKPRRGKSSRQVDQDSEFGREDDGFRNVSLD
ncbi:bicaudal-D-related protein 2-like [Amphiprion ocellaris]|uniref:bicaudal-D-related protein 2-like n=1 Tax=Amphiprion ocellaris TaxID=80972 RepID=UPI00241113FC|nr:bicaudal-D-related protein 2-like [Amphiprion ocellaris]XP_054873370.1 bicaudal-D-related protein 2-like [Amphiprion ocellaris]